jgi:tetratricopeptide (TPR) repeat protein
MAINTMKEGIRLYRNNNYSDALVSFLSVPTGDADNNLEIAYYIGLCYARLERYDDSLVYLEQVVTADTDLSRVYQCRMVLSVIYSLTGRTRLADFELRKLIDAGYESAQVFCSLAFLAFEHKNADEAVEWYEKAIGVDGKNQTALNGLGYVLADGGRDLTRALTMCKKALDMEPDNPSYLDSLGWVYHKLGLNVEARTYTRRAREKAPDNKIIGAHLAEIMQNGGGK